MNLCTEYHLESLNHPQTNLRVLCHHRVHRIENSHCSSYLNSLGEINGDYFTCKLRIDKIVLLYQLLFDDDNAAKAVFFANSLNLVNFLN